MKKPDLRYLNIEDPDFRQWMIEVDDAVMGMVGISADDLPDYAYWDNWNNGADPLEISRAVISEAGYDELLEMEE